MLITIIKGRALKDTDFNELRLFFSDYAFDMFMDKGREGINRVAEDMLDTFVEFVKQRDKRVTDLSEGDRIWALRATKRYLMDGFITKGSAGIEDGIRTAYTMTINTLREAADRKAS